MQTPYVVPPLTPAETALVDKINSGVDGWDTKALSELKAALQYAVEIELATIPIYLYTYYSVDRTPKGFPDSASSRFADKAGALILSVVVEEMLHLSLSSNVLHSLGGEPLIYGYSPASYPATLPLHATNTQSGEDDSRNIPIPLGKFSFDQLAHFLAIEYPAPYDAIPEGSNWDTIGQIYSYIRCIISSDWIQDDDFSNRSVDQIMATEFSPNSIDSVYPNAAFDKTNPIPAPVSGSAAQVAEFASDENSHLGASELITIETCEDALEAIATISFQGEGFAQESYDDADKDELSHYFKFLSVQSELDGYTDAYIEQGLALKNNVAPVPPAPSPPAVQFDQSDLNSFVCNFGANPVASDFAGGRRDLIEIGDGLYQYMLLMTETIFKVPSDKQKIYFNRSMHQSMIWVMDKFLRTLRKIKTEDDPDKSLCPTFANSSETPLGDRAEAFGTLSAMVNAFRATYGPDAPTPAAWYTKSGIDYYVLKILELPDVSPYWPGPPATNPPYLDNQTDQGQGTGGFSGVPRWPITPPINNELPVGASRHACMGLNSCEDQGRTAHNNCAGQGLCSTALSYNAAKPTEPGYADHTCHVKNDCRSQGGCGLYGTAKEFANPGNNDCQSKGSCATPINAERFITDGPLRGESVWVQARAVFTDVVWPGVRSSNPSLTETPPEIAGPTASPDLFAYGPTIEWIENGNQGKGMTSCGSSGMSGAGSCS